MTNANIDARFLTNFEILELFGGNEDNAVKKLNLRLNLPTQETGALTFNSCFELLSIVTDPILPGFENLNHERSTDLLVRSNDLQDYSRNVSAKMSLGSPCAFEIDARNYTIKMKSIEPLTKTSQTVWCYVERTIFFHLEQPYASLDMVMTETSTSFSPVTDQTEGPPDGITFIASTHNISKMIIYDKFSKMKNGMFHEQFRRLE